MQQHHTLQGECWLLTGYCLPAPMASSAPSFVQLFCRVAPHRSTCPPPHSPPPHASPDRYVSLSAIYGPTWLGMDSLVVSTLRRFHANNDRYYTLNFPLPITPRAKAEYISHTSLPQQVDSISIELGGHAVWSDSQTAMSRYVVAFTPAFPQRLQFLNHRSTPRHPTGLLGFHLQQPDPNLVD